VSVCLPTAGSGAEHLRHLRESLDAFAPHAVTVDRWGRELAGVLRRGGRLLAAGNGGSAAEAQHLTAELVGRYVQDREPLSALSLHAETSSLTAILNDYGPEEVYARQVRAHGRPGDVLVLLSTSGRSPNVVAAAAAGRRCGLTVWALTGPGPNDLSRAADEAVCVDAPSTATVQELHLCAVHMLAGAVDVALGVAPPSVGRLLDLRPAAAGQEVPA
jgi:D-sedoheptulose 7-phosphate isomerase